VSLKEGRRWVEMPFESAIGLGPSNMGSFATHGRKSESLDGSDH
jgi:hypothetical protein